MNEKRKVILYIAMSLDGYIADEKGSVDWLKGDNSDKESLGSYPAFIDKIDTIVMGYSTYLQITEVLSPEKWVYENKQCYILTHNAIADKKEIKFVNSSISNLLKTIKEKGKKDIWICGGASIINQTLKESALDEIIISVIPVLLGKGIRLFEEKKNRISLKLISTEKNNGIVDLHYAIIKN